MELKETLQVIRRRIILLSLILIISVSTTGYYSLSLKKSYETSSLITIQAGRENTNQYQYGGYYAIQASELFINTIIGWIKNTNTVADIYNDAKISFGENQLEDLGKKIYARKVPPQNMVLSIIDGDQEKSKKITESTINIIKDKTNRMSLVTNAATNFEIISSELITRPIEPNIYFNLFIALIAGFILGIIIIFLIEYLSPTINNHSKIRNIFKKDAISLRELKIKGLIHPETKESEKFRFLRANITPENEEKTKMIIASLDEQVDTALIASNLALSFARSGKKTILVDAYFGNASIHEYFNRPNDFGLSEFLFDEKNPGKYLQKTEEANLKIISAGIKLSYASDSIERSNLDKIINELEKEADTIIFNVPPLNYSSEAFPLFSVIKKIVLAIRLGKTNVSAANYINSFLTKKDVEKNIIAI